MTNPRLHQLHSSNQRKLLSNSTDDEILISDLVEIGDSSIVVGFEDKVIANGGSNGDQNADQNDQADGFGNLVLLDKLLEGLL